MTTPTGATPTPVAPTPAHTHAGAGSAVTLRALISIAETAAFIVAAILGAMNNGSDFRNAVITAFVGFIAHGVNHNAGGSPV